MPPSRRDFLRTICATAPAAIFAGASLDTDLIAAEDPAIIGHGTHRYRVNLNWGRLDSARYPIKDAHEMVEDSRGRIVLLTNHTKNNVLIYDKSGKLLESWGTDYPGAHGLTLSRENGEDFLWISDNARHEVIKTSLTGQVVMTLPYPKESGHYANANEYVPTEVAVAPDGDIYVADGYGKQFVIQYDARGKLVRTFGGRGNEPGSLDNAHGIAIDTRNPADPALLVTARQQNALKRYSLDGRHLETIALPGAYICRPVVHGKHVYFAVLISKLPWNSQSGFVLILDEKNRVVSAPGGSVPRYVDGKLNRLHQTLKVFRHPHDVCVDRNENVYVAQWNSGGLYPIQLVRV